MGVDVTFAGGTVAESALVDTSGGAEGFVAVGGAEGFAVGCLKEDVPGRIESFVVAIVLCLGRTAPETEGVLLGTASSADLVAGAAWATEYVVGGTAAFTTGCEATGCFTIGGAAGETALDGGTTGVIAFEAGAVCVDVLEAGIGFVDGAEGMTTGFEETALGREPSERREEEVRCCCRLSL